MFKKIHTYSERQPSEREESFDFCWNCEHGLRVYGVNNRPMGVSCALQCKCENFIARKKPDESKE